MDNTTVWSNWTSGVRGKCEVSETQAGSCRPTNKGWKHRGRFFTRVPGEEMLCLDYLLFTWRESGPDAPVLFPEGLFLFFFSLLPPRLGLPPLSLSSPFSLLLCPPWEMLADLPPQQMKQAAAPQGRCRGHEMQSLMFFTSTVEERGYGRAALEVTLGCGNVCCKDPPLPLGWLWRAIVFRWEISHVVKRWILLILEGELGTLRRGKMNRALHAVSRGKWLQMECHRWPKSV